MATGAIGPLSASSRIRKRSDFRAVQAEAARVVTRHFVFLLHMPALATTKPRLGITASRKVGGAIVRNRAKRLVREAFRSTRDLWTSDVDGAVGVDVVVIVRSALDAMRLDHVVDEWRNAAPALRRTLTSIAAAHSGTVLAVAVTGADTAGKGDR